MDSEYTKQHVIELLEAERFEECLFMCQQQVLASFDDKSANQYMAFCLLKLERYEEAIRVYNKLMTLGADITNYTYRGDCYFQLERYIEAIKDFKEALKLDHTIANLWQRVAIASFNNGNSDEAFANIERAIEFSDGQPYPLAIKATFLKNLGRTAEAFALMNEIRKAHPDFDELRKSQLNILTSAIKKKMPEYGYRSQLMPGRFVYYLAGMTDELGNKLYMGEGKIEKIYHTLIDEVKHYCCEFAEHSIAIDGKEIIMPKRVIIDDNVFLTKEAMNEYLENDGPIINID